MPSAPLPASPTSVVSTVTVSGSTAWSGRKLARSRSRLACTWASAVAGADSARTIAAACRRRRSNTRRSSAGKSEAPPPEVHPAPPRASVSTATPATGTLTTGSGSGPTSTSMAPSITPPRRGANETSRTIVSPGPSSTGSLKPVARTASSARPSPSTTRTSWTVKLSSVLSLRRVNGALPGGGSSSPTATEPHWIAE